MDNTACAGCFTKTTNHKILSFGNWMTLVSLYVLIWSIVWKPVNASCAVCFKPLKEERCIQVSDYTGCAVYVLYSLKRTELYEYFIWELNDTGLCFSVIIRVICLGISTYAGCTECFESLKESIHKRLLFRNQTIHWTDLAHCPVFFVS